MKSHLNRADKKKDLVWKSNHIFQNEIFCKYWYINHSYCSGPDLDLFPVRTVHRWISQLNTLSFYCAKKISAFSAEGIVPAFKSQNANCLKRCVLSCLVRLFIILSLPTLEPSEVPEPHPFPFATWKSADSSDLRYAPMFSATWPKVVRELAHEFLQPDVVQVKPMGLSNLLCLLHFQISFSPWIQKYPRHFTLAFLCFQLPCCRCVQNGWQKLVIQLFMPTHLAMFLNPSIIFFLGFKIQPFEMLSNLPFFIRTTLPLQHPFNIFF